MTHKIEYGLNTVGNFRLLGFATGNYSCCCVECGVEFIGDKQSQQCLACAIKAVEEKVSTPNKQNAEFKPSCVTCARYLSGAEACIECRDFSGWKWV